MMKGKKKQQEVLSIFLEEGSLASSEVYNRLRKKGVEASFVTVKRALSQLARLELLAVVGSGRATHYEISMLGRLHAEVDVKRYLAIEPDRRYGSGRWNREAFLAFPAEPFSLDEQRRLEQATAEYRQRVSGASSSLRKRELERLVIELSWKSSKIEGNTYTLLDTERLIREQKKAAGHSADEAQMILNHKEAFLFIHANAKRFKTLTRANIEKVHTLLVKNMGVGLGLRHKPVGVLGSKYRPLDNIHQITEAIEVLSKAVAKMKTPYAKAFLALLGVSYIQPFEDGNKRTSRLMANALLMAYGCAPLSYRSVDEIEYREAMLVWYELNTPAAMKRIFVDQYEFAAENYAVA